MTEIPVEHGSVVLFFDTEQKKYKAVIGIEQLRGKDTEWTNIYLESEVEP